ncbi:Mitotic spindle-associated MMXD complex subunit MIP18 [Thelohanellus kitauei]|uniref:Mitotic spindle-associated MMXD complex subunit MIP18 n=1 Tax=Thelohanellus kitauei TaxID=669202 RepID=A0A0C2NEI0_THEKT|nr:Mitotic spindle-associated MMXD complex subunit MIP18 [Thelohanellus kitauei]
MTFENRNPILYEKSTKRDLPSQEELDIDSEDVVDVQEVFELISEIADPEYTDMTLEQLGIVKPELITIDNNKKTIDVMFTPTIPECSMPSLIGLCIKAMLTRCLPAYKVQVRVEPGTHSQDQQISRQLSDKERFSAALEGKNLLSIINQCLNIKWKHRSLFSWVHHDNST